MMAAYRKEFDERMPALETAIRDMPGNLGDIVPGFSRERLLRLFKRLSILLGRLDSKGAKHPQYLWNEGVLAPASLIGQVDSVIANMASGAASFVQNNLPGLLKINDALEKAIGTDATEAKALASSVSTDLSIAVAQTDELQSKAERNVQVLGAIEKSAQAAQASIAVSLDQVKGDAERAATARRELEAMVNPDGRRKDSLETLARKARERIAEIETIFLAGSERLLEADKSANHAKSQQTEAELILTSLRSAKNEAEQVLHLSSQAGLASSYQRESERLQKRSTFFTGILYFSSAVTILLAAFYVLPELNKALSSSNDGIGFWQALSFTLLRASVLAPLVFVIYFTTRRVSELELLRMDYAEKAAASLAYSGYREQVEADEDLLRQLKGSLLMKFAEHPERLLRVGEMVTTARVKTPGFEAETLVGTRPSEHPVEAGS